MSTVIKRCRSDKKKKKRGKRKINGFPESEIPECPEHAVKSKIGDIFVNEKLLEEYSVKIDEIDPYLYEHYSKRNTR